MLGLEMPPTAKNSQFLPSLGFLSFMLFINRLGPWGCRKVFVGSRVAKNLIEITTQHLFY